MKTFRTYEAAQQAAQEMATSTQRHTGLAAATEFGSPVFNVFLLPNPENRTGHELTCEVVRPQQPEETREQKMERALRMFVTGHASWNWQGMDLAAEIAAGCGIEPTPEEQPDEDQD